MTSFFSLYKYITLCLYNRHVDWSNYFLLHYTMQSFLFIMFYLIDLEKPYHEATNWERNRI